MKVGKEFCEIYSMHCGDGLVLLSGGRDRRQLVLLLMLSIKSSLWMQVRRQSKS